MSNNTLQVFTEIEELLAKKNTEWKEFKRLEKDDKVIESPLANFFFILKAIFHYSFYVVFFLSFIPLIIIAFKYISEELLNFSGGAITTISYSYEDLYTTSMAGILLNVIILIFRRQQEFTLLHMVPWLPIDKKRKKKNKIFKAIAVKRYIRAKNKLNEIGIPKEYQHNWVIEIMKVYEVDNLSEAIKNFEHEWENTEAYEKLQKTDNDDLMDKKLIKFDHLSD